MVAAGMVMHTLVGVVLAVVVTIVAKARMLANTVAAAVVAVAQAVVAVTARTMVIMHMTTTMDTRMLTPPVAVAAAGRHKQQSYRFLVKHSRLPCVARIAKL